MKRIDLLDVPEEARDLIRECELQGTKTLFTRDGREVAILVSWDEYLALRETLAITNNPLFFATLETAEEEVRKGKMLLVEDLLRVWNDRLRLAESIERAWSVLTSEERAEAMRVLERIDDDPIAGAPLFEPLKGLWSYRTSSLRIVYRIVPEARFVVVLSIAKTARADEL